MTPNAEAAINDDWLELRALQTPRRTALIDATTGRAASFASLHAAAGRQVERWRDLRPGPIAVHESDSFRVAVALFAALRAGRLVVILNRRLSARELDAQLGDVGHPPVAGTPPAGGREAGAIECVEFDMSESVDISTRAYPLFDERIRHDVITSDSPLGQPAALGLFTSGTTGRSRCAVLPRRALLASAIASAGVLGERDDDVWLACMPLFHVGGLSILLRSVISGAPVVMLDSFDVDAVEQASRTYRPTLASFVPTMLQRLVDRGVCGDSYRACLIGGAAAAPSLLSIARAHGWPALPTYGLTEAASQVATARSVEPTTDGVIGPPIPGARLSIGNPDADGVGEVLIESPTLMLGYLDPATLTIVPRTSPFRSGDLGRIDELGRLCLVGRRADLIVTGGENVYPAEVESALMASGMIVDVAVVGIDDREWGQRVAAAVVARAPFTLDDIARFAGENLAAHRRPRIWLAVDELPRNSTGKLDRIRLRELLSRPQATTPT